MRIISLNLNGVRAAERKGFRLYTGPDASAQPADIADILLHETAVSLFKRALGRSRPRAKPWLETRNEFAARAKAVAREANKQCNFKQLCCEYLERLRLLVEARGDRLRKRGPV